MTVDILKTTERLSQYHTGCQRSFRGHPSITPDTLQGHFGPSKLLAVVGLDNAVQPPAD